ncbi:MAG: hypothetical protein ACNS60_21285 [Candidatus Cyclobacteriaceae bacterium M2_1C_046]
MKLPVSEVSKLLKIEKDLIKKWSFQFGDFLNPEANPEKGKPRQYIPEDLGVFMYISYHWEEEPDLGAIMLSLHAGEHQGFPFYEIVTQIKPFFMEPPEELNADWRHGALRGTFGSYVDRFSLAQEYKLAGDLLVEAAIQNDTVYEVLAPIIYNYRHATELYLKEILDYKENTHDLNCLFIHFKELVKEKYKSDLPYLAENLILSFHKFDPGGTSFRYEGTDPFSKEETWVDVEHLKIQMDWLWRMFMEIKAGPAG